MSFITLLNSDNTLVHPLHSEITSSSMALASLGLMSFLAQQLATKVKSLARWSCIVVYQWTNGPMDQ